MPIWVESSVVIDCPLEEVFSFLLHNEREVEWQAELIESTVDGPPGIGRVVRHVRDMLGRKIENDMECVEFEPPHLIAYRVVKGPLPYYSETRLEAVEGGTRITITFDGEMGGFFALANEVIASAIKQELEANLGKLKTLLESEGPASER